MLLEKARELGKDCIVTGHYARIERAADGRYLLKKGTDLSKDQSYVLYSLTQEQLSHTRFPLGGMMKSEVREIAITEGFHNAVKNDSQDICFVPDGDYTGFIEKNIDETPYTGRFVDADGNDLGESKSIIHYTIGQRRGLGLAMPYPVYVLDIRPEDNTVVLGKDEMLFSKTLYMRNINLIALDRLDSPIGASVKIRYKHTEQPAVIRQIDDDTLHVEFEEPQRAITRGQAAVIFDGDTVIGGGTIT
jgi:tRNA-specific 2-thiouridylase